MKKIIIPLLIGLLPFAGIMNAATRAPAKTNAVYVSDSGSDSNDGNLSAAPLKTLKAAYKKLGGDGTIVVCGKLTLNAASFPKSGAVVKITSVHQGENFADAGAAIVFASLLNIRGDTLFENITFSQKGGPHSLSCLGNNVTFGKGINCVKTGKFYPSIIGGMSITSKNTTHADASFYNYTIRIDSGQWHCVQASNRRNNDAHVMGETGNVRLVINGGSFHATGGASHRDSSVIGVGSFSSQKGDYSLEINGGSFSPAIFGIARSGDNSTPRLARHKGNLVVKINGGTFRGKSIDAVQDLSANYVNGNYRLEINGGTFAGSLKTLSAKNVRGTASRKVPEALIPKLSGFDNANKPPLFAKRDLTPEEIKNLAGQSAAAAGKHVFLAENGKGDGGSLSSPLGSLSAAVKALPEGGVIVVCGEYDLAKPLWLPAHPKKITVTSRFAGIDFRGVNGARINLGANLHLGGNTVFEEVDFFITGRSAIYCNFKETVFGDGINCVRDFDGVMPYYADIWAGCELTNSNASRIKGDLPSVLTIKSGTWNSVSAGNRRLVGGTRSFKTTTGKNIVNISGGTFKGMVAGTGMNHHEGDIIMNISGGTFDCSLYGTASPASTDADVAVVDGNISINISDGDFRGGIAVAHDKRKTLFNGHYKLSVSGGNFTRVSEMSGTAKIKGKNNSTFEAKGVDLDKNNDAIIEYSNPIMAREADPTVLFHEGWYYYARPVNRGSGTMLCLSKAANLCDIGSAAQTVVWQSSEGDGGELKNIWAVQLYRLDGKFYIYATCSPFGTGVLARRLPYVWVAKTDDPFDGFSLHGVIDNTDTEVDNFLSPRVLEWAGKRYIVCGGIHRPEDHISGVIHFQKLFMGELESPTRFKTPMTVISQPSEPWEYNGKVSIQEGPFPLISPDGKTFYLPFAANEASTDHYATGLLEFTGKKSDSPANPRLWKKHKKPLQQYIYGDRVFSPGAMVFTKTPDGEKTLALYHVKLHSTYSFAQRALYMQELTWQGNLPVIGKAPLPGKTFTLKANPMPLRKRITGFNNK